MIFGTSSDRIGTTHGRSFYATASKDLEALLGLPLAPYAGLAFGTFDDEFVAIGGLVVRWAADWRSTSLWDGHNLHHVIETQLGARHTLGLVIAELDGAYDFGIAYSLAF